MNDPRATITKHLLQDLTQLKILSAEDEDGAALTEQQCAGIVDLVLSQAPTIKQRVEAQRHQIEQELGEAFNQLHTMLVQAIPAATTYEMRERFADALRKSVEMLGEYQIDDFDELVAELNERLQKTGNDGYGLFSNLNHTKLVNKHSMPEWIRDVFAEILRQAEIPGDNHQR